jgi:tetratricopeptide (TPR) repeat protein
MMSGAEAADLDKLWDYSAPGKSEGRFRERLRETAPDSQAYVQVLTQLARAQGLQGQFAEAHTTLDEAEGLLAEEMGLARVRYLLERGRVHNSAGEREQAGRLFREALERATSIGADFYAVDAAHMLGICEPTERQAGWHQEAIARAERSADPRARGWLGSLYNNFGWTLHDQGNYAGALALFEKAERFRAEQGKARELLIARWCVARCLRSLGRVEEALEQQRALLADHEAAGSDDAYVAEEVGECLLALGRGEEARPWFARAHAALAQDSWMQANEAGRLERLRQLAAAAWG